MQPGSSFSICGKVWHRTAYRGNAGAPPLGAHLALRGLL
jgi:hypothetical protein